MVFHGVQNLPVIAARELGLFGTHHLKVEIAVAPSSDEMRTGLADGRYQIVHGAVDNAVAMAEAENVDIAVVMGGDNGFCDLFVRPEIQSYEDLRGKNIVVDAAHTAFALVLYKVLARNGLNRGDYLVNPLGAGPLRLAGLEADPNNGAAILNLPFSILARRGGLRSMGAVVDQIGPYLSTCAFVRREWLTEHGDAVLRYIRAYVEGLRWALNRANEARAIDLLERWLRQPRDIARACYDIAVGAKDGFAPDAAVDLSGFANVLSLRADIEKQWAGVPPSPHKYLDLSWREQAMAAL